MYNEVLFSLLRDAQNYTLVVNLFDYLKISETRILMQSTTVLLQTKKVKILHEKCNADLTN